MKDEKTVRYILGKYQREKLNPVAALDRFHAVTEATQKPSYIRRWLFATAGLASMLVVFAAVRYMVPKLGQPRLDAEQVAETPIVVADYPVTEDFVFKDAPLDTVLQMLSSHYGCKLSASDTVGHLNGSFQKSDDVELVVRAIEHALGIEIEIGSPL